MENKNSFKIKERGLVKEVIIMLVALIALKYFWHIDVVGYLSDKINLLIAKFKH